MNQESVDMPGISEVEACMMCTTCGSVAGEVYVHLGLSSLAQLFVQTRL